MAGQRESEFPELWGGVECTVNRVGDRFYDQLERSGYGEYRDDLGRFAALGLRTLRLPVLWEKAVRPRTTEADWTLADRQLHRAQELGIRPIAGLVHHGSGPSHTDLLDPAWPLLLAEYAEAVARRYPWIDRYTPVNEPLTTARFSGLYGLWYPHATDAPSFARALVNQCRGVVLAMERIRKVNPEAQLVQTEDLGKVFSTGRLAYQAEFENERRWLTFDLLCGRVGPDHSMWNYLLHDGQVPAEELRFFQAHPCPPDIVGINYYLTSERLLDERLSLYPPSTHGGNGRDRYADVEAVRLRPEGLAGPRALLTEVWERYRLPIAVTEVHNGCTREEQLRWLQEVWDAGVALKADGVDLLAVTLWALLGTFDWNTLVTRQDGHYEPGAFDLRSPAPRASALAHLARELAAGRRSTHPVLDMPGWWHRSKRFLFAHSLQGTPPRASQPPAAARPILITGATGTLGQAFGKRCELRGLAHRMLTRAEMDIADPFSVETALALHGGWALVNAAGFVRVDDAERDPERCFRENTLGPAVLAEICQARGVPLLTFSTDLVFDGRRNEPYREASEVGALNVYGLSKVRAERRVLARHTGALIVRSSAFFGPWDEENFLTLALRTISRGRPFRCADDTTVSPTYLPDLVDAALDLLIDGERGIWHLANQGALTWADFARRGGAAAGFDPGLVAGCPAKSLGLRARRPQYSALRSDRGTLLPGLDHALQRYVADTSVLGYCSAVNE